MSIIQINDCQCMRFPAGTAIDAGERSKQKANIQICKNNILLNCNKDIPNLEFVRRVYSGTQNRLRSINGCKLKEQKCEPDATCIFSEKSSSDYWIMENSVSDDNYKYTRITTNPTVEVLVEGPLNKAVLQSLAIKYGNPDFLNPTEIIIGTEVTEISEDLLDGMSPKLLTTLGVKTYLINKCKTIKESAFKDCVNLTSATIPDSVIYINNYVFQNCSNLSSINIGKSVELIGGVAFSNCTSLTSIVIPDSVTSILDAAFLGCLSLTSVVLPNFITNINQYTFTNCSSLTSITIPASVVAIDTHAFAGCTSLTSVTFKKNINVSINTNNTWVSTPVGSKTATFPTGGTATPSTGDKLSDITSIDLSAASGDVVFSA